MPEPISWQVLEFLKERLQQVTVANGFLTDLGAGTIALDRDQVREDDAPATLIFGIDFVTPENAVAKRTLTSDMDVVIEFQVPYESAESPMRMAHRARADVLRVLSGELRGGPAGFRSLVVTGSSVTPPEGGNTTIVAQVTARAGLSEPLSPA